MTKPPLLLMLAAACSSRPGGETRTVLPRVQVHTVRGAAQGGADWVAGSVVAKDHAAISTRVSATVRAVAVQEGTRVRKGALLARLADEDLRSQLAAARSGAAAAAAHSRRIETLARQGQATRSELEAAQARRAQSDAQVSAARENLSYAEMRAPFDGVVQRKQVSAGDLVEPGKALFELDGSDLEIAGSVDEAEARRLQTGQPLRFTASGREGTAVVSALAPGGDPVTHRGVLRARVTAGSEGLRAGDFARLEIPPAARSQLAATNLWVPQTSLVDRGDLTGVFVIKDGRAELRWLALGEPAGNAVPVRAGLDAADEIIDAPGLLRDGQPVEVARGQ